MTLTGHATVLLVPDVPATLAWYRDRLGFDVSQYDNDPDHVLAFGQLPPSAPLPTPS